MFPRDDIKPYGNYINPSGRNGGLPSHQPPPFFSIDTGPAPVDTSIGPPPHFQYQHNYNNNSNGRMPTSFEVGPGPGPDISRINVSYGRHSVPVGNFNQWQPSHRMPRGHTGRAIRIKRNAPDQWVTQFHTNLRLLEGEVFPLQQAAVLAVLTPLGDARLRGATNIKESSALLNVAAALQRQFFAHPDLILVEVSTTCLPGDTGDSTGTGRGPVNDLMSHNISVLASSLVEAAAFLTDHLSFLAAFLAIFMEQATRLPDGITIADLSGPTFDEPLGKRQSPGAVANAKAAIAARLLAATATFASRRLMADLSRGHLMEARNIVRFFYELANLELVQPTAILRDIILPILDAAGKMREMKTENEDDKMSDIRSEAGLYGETLVYLVISSFPWLAREVLVTVEHELSGVWDWLEKYFETRLSPPLKTAFAPIWGTNADDDDTLQDHLQFAYKALLSLRTNAEWVPKVISRIYSASDDIVRLLNSRKTVPHHPGVNAITDLAPVQVSTEAFITAMERNRSSAAEVAAGAGEGALQRATIEAALGAPLGTAAYAASAVDIGVGGGSLGLNGTWVPKAYLEIWSVEDLLHTPALLKGVEPLAFHNKWILREIFTSILHAFRHNCSLCADMLLTVHVAYDHMEIVLVETVIDEMLRFPHSAEPRCFYYRLFDHLCRKQHSTRVILESAIERLVSRCENWDHQTMELITEFLGFYLSTLPEGPAAFRHYDAWGPERFLSQNSLNDRLGLGSSNVVDVDNRLSLIQQQPQPPALKTFLFRVMDHLARLLWPGSYIETLPSWLQCFVPETPVKFSCVMYSAYKELQAMIDAKPENKGDEIENEGQPKTDMDGQTKPERSISNEVRQQCPLEYAVLMSLILLRLDADRMATHREIMSLRLLKLLLSCFLNQTRLAAFPNEQYLSRLTSCPGSSSSGKDAKFTKAAIAREVSRLAQEGVNGRTSAVFIKPEGSVEIEEENVPDATSIVKPEVPDQDPSEDTEFLSSDATGGAAHGTAAIVKREGLDLSKVKDFEGDSASEEVDLPELASSDVTSETLYHVSADSSNGVSPKWNFIDLVDLVLRVLLAKGSVSLTHTARVLENYALLLKWLRPSSERPYAADLGPRGNDASYCDAVLRAIFAFWRDAPVRSRFVVDKMLRLHILASDEIQAYIFESLPLQRILLTQDLLWRIERELVSRMIAQQVQYHQCRRRSKFESGLEGLVEEKLLQLTAAEAALRRSVAHCLNGFIRRSQRLASPDDKMEDRDVVDIEEGEDSAEATKFPKASNDTMMMYYRRLFLRQMIHFGRTFVNYINFTDIAAVSEDEVGAINMLQTLQGFLFPRGSVPLIDQKIE